MKILTFLLFTNIFNNNLALEMKLQQFSKNYNKILDFLNEQRFTDLTSASQTRLIMTDETEETNEMIEYFMESDQMPTLIFRENRTMDSDYRLLASIALVLMKNEKELDSMIENLRKSSLFIVITQTIFIRISQIKNATDFNFDAVMQQISNYGLTQYIFLYLTDEIHLISYDPFARKTIDLSEKFGIDIFPNYLKNMHRYKLKVSLFEEWPILKKETRRRLLGGKKKWIGRDYVLLEILSKLMNFSIIVIEPKNGTRYKGAQKDILRKAVDFCFVRRFQEEAIDGINFLSTGDLSSLDVLVPKPKRLNQSEVMFLIFQNEIWIALLVTSIILIISIKFFVIKSGKIPKWTIAEITVDMWAMLMNTAIKNFHNYNRILRISTILWIWSCLVLSASFQCRFMDAMQFPKFAKSIKTLKKLQNSDVILFSSHNYTKLQGNVTLLRKNFNLMEHTKFQRFIQTNSSSNYAFILPFAVIKGHINPDVFIGQGQETHELLHEALTHSFAVYMFPSYSPYKNEFQKNILLQKQFGFLEKVFGNIKIVSRKFANVKQVGMKLSLHHLQPAFTVLAMGYFSCSLSFLLEILFWKIRSEGKFKCLKICKNELQPKYPFTL